MALRRRRRIPEQRQRIQRQTFLPPEMPMLPQGLQLVLQLLPLNADGKAIQP